MSQTVGITFKCKTATGDSVNFPFSSNISPEVESSDVQTAGNALITNGALFNPVPVTLVSAELKTTTTEEMLPSE